MNSLTQSGRTNGISAPDHHLVVHRTVLVLCAVLYPSWSLFLRLALPEAFDDWGQRLFVGFLFGVVLALSYVSRAVRDHIQRISLGFILLMTGHFYYLTFQANFSIVYAIGCIVFSCALSGLFFQQLDYLVFSVFNLACATTVASRVTAPIEVTLIAIAGLVTVHVTFFFIISARRKTLELLRQQKANAEVLQLELLEYKLREAKSQAEKFKEQAHYDELTGLANRALFEELMGHSFALAIRTPCPDLALLFIDLDGFKAVNDTMGHEAGDLVLKEFSERLRLSIRKGDIPARLGGDEFVVILPQTLGHRGAEVVGERILASLKTPVRLPGNGRLTISASIGISMLVPSTLTSQALIKQADIAMYQAKEKGKNQIVSFTSAAPVSEAA